MFRRVSLQNFDGLNNWLLEEEQPECLLGGTRVSVFLLLPFSKNTLFAGTDRGEGRNFGGEIKYYSLCELHLLWS